VRPARVGSPDRERHAEIELARARLFSAEGVSPESVAALREVAVELADTAAGLLAAELYPRRFRELAAIAGPPALSERAQARSDVAALAARRCGAGRRAIDERGSPGTTACPEIRRLERQLDEWDADDDYRTCTASDGPSAEACTGAAKRYAALWRDHFAAQCRAGEPDCTTATRLLVRGADAAERGGMPSLTLALLSDLLDPSFGLSATAEAQLAGWGTARAHHALGARAVAADWYERFARAEPSHESAPTALALALVLRLEQGSSAELLRARQSYDARHRGRAPALDAEVDLAFGAWLAGRDAWADASAVLREAARLGEQADRPDLVLQAHALLSRGARRKGLGATAATAVGVGCSAWERTRNRLGELVARSLHPADRGERQRHIVDAAAELLTSCADSERDADRPLPMPTFQGAPARAALERFVDQELGPWLAGRRQRIERLAGAYGRVLELPAPGAEVARIAAARDAVASLWVELADELRSAHHPNAWNQLGVVPGSSPPVLWAELRAGYHELVRARGLELRPAMVAACQAAHSTERATVPGAQPGSTTPTGCAALLGP
jgi:hypothetical protein